MSKTMHSGFYFLGITLLSMFVHAQQSPTTEQATTSGTTQAQTPARPQSAPKAYEPATVLKIKTRLVVVDVVARDNKGKPVTDLKAEDFTVSEDGKPQNIRSFSFQAPSLEASKLEVSAPSVNVFNNLPRYRPNGALNVLLLDALNSNLLDQEHVRASMVEFLKKLPSGQPIAIYLLGYKLRLVQDFTSDPEVLKAAISNLKSPGSGIVDNPAGTSPLSDLPPGGVAQATLAILPQMRAQILGFQNERIAAQTGFRVQYTLAALNALARTLSGYPGRKNLMWMSESFPFDIRTVAKGAPSAQNFSYEVAATGSLLSDAQVAVYPIDARGLVNHSVYSVGSDPNPMAGNSLGNATLGGAMGQGMDGNADELMAAHSTMNDLAEKTGGKAFYNRNDLESAITESVNDGSTYYTLGYYPDNKDWNGEFRKIQIKIHRPGVKVRYRLGYIAMDKEAFMKANPARQDAEFDQALSLEWPVATSLLFQAQVSAPSPETQNKVLVRFRIDPRGLSFEQGTDGLQHVAVLCAVRAYSTAALEKPVKTEANKLEGPLRAEAFAKIMNGFFPCQQQLDLPSGDYVLRLGIRDNSTGLIGTAAARVTVPPVTAAAAGAALSEKKP